MTAAAVTPPRTARSERRAKRDQGRVKRDQGRVKRDQAALAVAFEGDRVIAARRAGSDGLAALGEHPLQAGDVPGSIRKAFHPYNPSGAGALLVVSAADLEVCHVRIEGAADEPTSKLTPRVEAAFTERVGKPASGFFLSWTHAGVVRGSVPASLELVCVAVAKSTVDRRLHSLRDAGIYAESALLLSDALQGFAGKHGASLWIGHQRAFLFIYGEDGLVFARGLGAVAEPEPEVPAELADFASDSESASEAEGLVLDVDELDLEPEVAPELGPEAIARELVASIRHCRFLSRRAPSRIVLTGPRAEALLRPLEEATGLDLDVAHHPPKDLQLPPGADSEVVAPYASLIGGMAAGGTGELLPSHLRNLRALKRAAKVWLAVLLLLVAGAVVFFGQIRAVKQRAKTALNAAAQRKEGVAARKRALATAQAEVADAHGRFEGLSTYLHPSRHVGQTLDALVELSPQTLAWLEVELSDGAAEGLLEVDLVVEALETGPPELLAERLRPLVHGELEGPTRVVKPTPEAQEQEEPSAQGGEASKKEGLAQAPSKEDEEAFELLRFRLRFTVDPRFWRGVVGQRQLDGSLGEQR